MEDGFKNKFGFILFILIVIGLATFGFFYTRYTIEEMKNASKQEKEEYKDYKIDEDKDYIYYKNEETISEEGEIYYKDVVINLSTQEMLNENLEKENKIYKNNIRYIQEGDLLSSELKKYDYDNIYSLMFREYKNYEYNNYVSLVLKDYNFSCFDDITFNKTRSYVFDVKTGESLTEEEILEIYHLTMDDVKGAMKTYLEGKQSSVDGTNVIKIDETINELDNYGLYINDYGHLCITYLVKTTQVDYNEDMEVK